MQKVFAEPSRSLATRQCLELPLPSEGEEALMNRKRPRASADEEARPPTPLAVLARSDRGLLSRFIKFGDQALTAAEWFRDHESWQTSGESQATEPTGSSSSTLHSRDKYRWCHVALRQALSLLCRFIALDGSRFFLGLAPSTKTVDSARSTTTGDDAQGSLPSAAESEPAARVTTLELYCRLQALQLELEDTVLRAEAVATQTVAVPEAMRQQLTTDVQHVVCCIAKSVNSLEAALVQMLLSAPGATPSIAEVALRSATPTLEYVGKLLGELSAVVQAEHWPAQFICNRSVERGTSSTELDAASKDGRYMSSSLGEVLLPSGGSPASPAADHDAMDSTARQRASLGGAATSLALKSLFDLRTLDVCNVLGTALVSPLSRLAALEKLSAGSKTSTGEALSSSTRSPLHLESITFEELLVRAWNHHYGSVGLYRLHVEVRALFQQILTKAEERSPPNRDAVQRDVQRMWKEWTRIVQARFQAFMNRVATPSEAVDADDTADELSKMMRGQTVDEFADADENACDVMRRHTVAKDRLTDVQAVTARVVTKLQATDVQGWFAVPAFDLVNVDFTSVRYWILSPSFMHKSKRDAYRSLCRVLERMVDSCVRKYGPTHAFSETITKVRQQLVDVARAEGLL